MKSEAADTRNGLRHVSLRIRSRTVPQFISQSIVLTSKSNPRQVNNNIIMKTVVLALWALPAVATAFIIPSSAPATTKPPPMRMRMLAEEREGGVDQVSRGGFLSTSSCGGLDYDHDHDQNSINL